MGNAWQKAHPERMREVRKVKRDRTKARIDEIKAQPCADCGESYPPYVMDFDHRDPSTKEMEIGGRWHLAWSRLEAEIAKCDVVCANCHRERTHGVRV